MRLRDTSRSLISKEIKELDPTRKKMQKLKTTYNTDNKIIVSMGINMITEEIVAAWTNKTKVWAQKSAFLYLSDW